jgi:hypothetical protein
MASCLFNQWVVFFIADEDMDSDQRFYSTIVLVVATILWPIIVPLAYLELLKFHKKHKNLIDLLINVPKGGSYDE